MIKTNTNISIKLHKEFKNKTILITGGAGSLGSAITKSLLEYKVKSIRLLDINEHALFNVKHSLNDTRIRLLLGNILDKDRLMMAVKDVDIVIHAAALKNIEITEYNPIDTIDVNVNGTVNLLKATMINQPKKFINISTDKVVESSTLYGTTKQLAEKLIQWAGPHLHETIFASVRMGNIIETRGNVFEIWREESQNNKPLSITHPKMKRYFFHMDEAVDFINKCILLMKTGEIYIPKMKSYHIKDLASKFSTKFNIIGLRPGEKLDEILITEEEKKVATENNDMWILKHNFPISKSKKH